MFSKYEYQIAFFLFSNEHLLKTFCKHEYQIPFSFDFQMYMYWKRLCKSLLPLSFIEIMGLSPKYTLYDYHIAFRQQMYRREQ